MNSFLQGCCFVPPEDDIASTPSFAQLSPHLVPSSRTSSNANSCSKSLDGKNIVYIKRFPGGAWADLDEDKKRVNSHSSSTNSSGKISETNGSTSNTRTRRRNANCSRDARLILSEDEFHDHMFCLCQPRNQRPESSSYMSAYGSKSPRRPATSTSRLLDLISMCFWKCSPGCQQIPTINM